MFKYAVQLGKILLLNKRWRRFRDNKKDKSKNFEYPFIKKKMIRAT